MLQNVEKKMYSSLGIKQNEDRNKIFKYADDWLENKKAFDGAEGLWRIHDDLYDVTDFIKLHPGGKFWLEVTKGADITESFESHHLSTAPEKILPKYFKRKAVTPRNTPFTFKENGFYKTLKRNVREVCKDLSNTKAEKTKMMIDAVFLTAITLGVVATAYSNYLVGILAGFFLSCCTIASHNYYHQKDSWRMYYNDIAMVSSREWRIVHVFSHHAYTNTIADMQAFALEPLLQYHPVKKSVLAKYFSYIYGPFFLWTTMFQFLYISRMYHWIVMGNNKHISRDDLLPFALPTFLYVVTNQSLWTVIGIWSVMLVVNSFWFSVIGSITNHLNPDIFMDGDEPRSEEEMDWGIHQLDTVAEKHDIVNNHFFGLITFGDHALHHLFPALDHGTLQELYPIFRKTLEEFNLDFRVLNMSKMVTGYFQQLSKEIPNQNPPNLFQSCF